MSKGVLPAFVVTKKPRDLRAFLSPTLGGIGPETEELSRRLGEVADGQGGGVGQAELCARGIEMVGEQGHVGAVQQAGAEVGAQPHLTLIIQPEGFDLASLVGMRAPKCARSGIVMQADDPRRGFQADIDPLRAVLEVPRTGGIDGVVAADESG